MDNSLNERFKYFIAKIDGLMQKKILEMTKVDITDTSAEKILGELYQKGSVTAEQV